MYQSSPGAIHPRARDWGLAIALAAGCALAWAIGFSVTRQAPAYDSAEQLVWGYALQAGYWKHPPATSWIMHALLALFGPSVPLTFFAAQGCAAVALLLAWRLGCEFMPPARSLAAMALSTLVAYHSFALDEFNHDSVLLASEAAAALSFWIAVRRERYGPWAVAGVCARLALLVKYVALFPLAAQVLYLLLDRSARTRRNLPGFALAASIGLAMLVPHLAWLVQHQFLPIAYAKAVAMQAGSVGQLAGSLALFLLVQLACLLPLALAWLYLRRRGDVQPPALPPRGAPYLWIVGLAPMAMMLLYGLATRTEILPRWGAANWLFIGWIALAAGGAIARVDTRTVLRAVAVVQATLWLGVVALLPWGVQRLDIGSRANFPGRQLAASAQETWRHFTRQPLHYVISDTWLAGNIAAYSPAPLAVLVDGAPQHAAWVSMEDVKRCGALVVQDASPAARNVPTPVHDYLRLAAIRGSWTLPWAPTRGLHRPFGTVTQIAWGILPPAGGCALNGFSPGSDDVGRR